MDHHEIKLKCLSHALGDLAKAKEIFEWVNERPIYPGLERLRSRLNRPVKSGEFNPLADVYPRGPAWAANPSEAYHVTPVTDDELEEATRGGTFEDQAEGFDAATSDTPSTDDLTRKIALAEFMGREGARVAAHDTIEDAIGVMCEFIFENGVIVRGEDVPPQRPDRSRLYAWRILPNQTNASENKEEA